MEKEYYIVVRDFFYTEHIEIVVEAGDRISITYFGMGAAGEDESGAQEVRTAEYGSVQELYCIMVMLEQTLEQYMKLRKFCCARLTYFGENRRRSDDVFMSFETCQSLILLVRLDVDMLQDDDVVSFTIGI